MSDKVEVSEELKVMGLRINCKTCQELAKNAEINLKKGARK